MQFGGIYQVSKVYKHNVLYFIKLVTGLHTHSGGHLISLPAGLSISYTLCWWGIQSLVNLSATQCGYICQWFRKTLSQSVSQSVIKQSIYFEWHWEPYLLHSAINVNFSPFVLLHKYASFLEILNYACNSITTFLHSEIFTEVLTEMLKWFIVFVQHRRPLRVFTKTFKLTLPWITQTPYWSTHVRTFLCSM